MSAIIHALKGLGTLLSGSKTAEMPEPNHHCLVGNVVNKQEFSETMETRLGTKHFTPGTKVYCLPPQWGDGYENAIVIGICRKSRRWITVVMSAELITNWRVKSVYQAGVVRRLRKGFDGFNAQWESREQAEALAAGLRRRDGLGH